MSMYNDILWREKGNTEKCVQNFIRIATYVRRFPRGRWSFLGPGSEEKWYGTYSDKPDGNWDRTNYIQNPVTQYFVPPVPLREEK